ncbi:MAG: tRNA (N(6)-L-threonylcarbamoyladenosine(37)-C(2))-methylthiotransferase MtaB [Erysipelotrichaceae bacterium]|nr:tRNA (N(6)-L-threonylcarbamoyladenosine(37)-C(2))-methylthiotransferase MtaB [Erysipelotrichaceae bacterium]
MKFIVYTLGCKVNSYESAALEAAFLARGYEEANKDDANIVVINTCSVTSNSDKKSRQAIRRYIRTYKEAIIVAMGCYSQVAVNTLKKIEGLDIIVGTSRRSLIPSLIDEFKENRKQIIAVEPNSRQFCYEELGAPALISKTRAYLKIQDGCDNYCSYCIIPQTRGVSRSRTKEKIIEEAKLLTDHGYQEIILTGIDLGSFSNNDGKYTLTHLIKDILLEAPSLKRLRISSIEASQITPEFIKLLKEEPRIAEHLHIPLQSGSKQVLAKMNRHYDPSEYKKIINKVREVVPNIAITTDVIVGFPGESEEHFLETYDLINEVAFSDLHVFPYSKRSSTPAAKLKNEVPSDVKKQRVQKLSELGERLSKKYSAKFKGEKVEVIFETYDELTKTYRGHTSNYLLVETKSNKDLRGHLKEIIY